MVKPEDWIKNPVNSCWVHGMDALEHIFKGDTQKTAYKFPETAGPDHLGELREEMARPLDPGDFLEVLDLQDYSRPRRRPRRAPEGDFDIDDYLAGEREPFTEWVKEPREVRALTIILEITVPWGDRTKPYMAPRHKRVYSLALEAENRGIPCRVVAALLIKIPEKREIFRLYAMIKDYADPIFPQLWGGIKTNKAANAFWNSLTDYLVGTRELCNGTASRWDVARDFPEDEEVVLIDPKFAYKS
jgi:hypothetical protein